MSDEEEKFYIDPVEGGHNAWCPNCSETETFQYYSDAQTWVETHKKEHQ